MEFFITAPRRGNIIDKYHQERIYQTYKATKDTLHKQADSVLKLVDFLKDLSETILESIETMDESTISDVKEKTLQINNYSALCDTFHKSHDIIKGLLDCTYQMYVCVDEFAESTTVLKRTYPSCYKHR